MGCGAVENRFGSVGQRRGETTARQCRLVGHGGLKAARLREEGTRAQIEGAGAGAGLQGQARAADAGAGAGSRYQRECR